MGFYLIMLAVFAVNIYLSRGLAHRLGIKALWIKIIYYPLYFAMVLSYFLSRLFMTVSANDRTDTFTALAGHALPSTLYAVLIICMYKLLRYGYVKISGKTWPVKAQTGFYVLLVALLTINVYGYYNAVHPVRQSYEVPVGTNLPVERLKIVMVSDLHLGKNTDLQFVYDFIGKVNNEQADLIVLIGDIIDSDLESVKRKQLLSPLAHMKAKNGVYAVLGNHEYISKQPHTVINMLRSVQVKVLVDQTAFIPNLNVGLIGLNDIGHRRADNKDTATIALLAGQLPNNSIKIMLDHQPGRILNAAENKISLTLSGHTHRGQYYPLNYVTQQIFLNDWGLKKFDDTYSVVSCGYGNWGANMRVGSRTELVVLNLVRQ